MGLPSDPSVEKIAGGGANTHIVYHAGKLMALQEGSNPSRWIRPILRRKVGLRRVADLRRILRWILIADRCCGSPTRQAKDR